MADKWFYFIYLFLCVLILLLYLAGTCSRISVDFSGVANRFRSDKKITNRPFMPSTVKIAPSEIHGGILRNPRIRVDFYGYVPSCLYQSILVYYVNVLVQPPKEI